MKRSLFAAIACALVVLSSCADETAMPDFADQAAPSSQAVEGVIVTLFEWRWDDVAAECEQFLGPHGFAAVQVSSPIENSIVASRPWWERYQPVSYQFENRSGNREGFRDMVSRCREAGVDIYVDTILNHLTGVYEGVGTAGSTFGEYEYPGLYSREDFHACPTQGHEISDWNSSVEVRDCELVNLADLKTESESVRAKLAAYLRDLKDLGVAGIRLDAAKHMPARDIAAILKQAEFEGYVVQEVNEESSDTRWMGEYYANGDVTEFRYGGAIADAFQSGRLDRLHGDDSIWTDTAFGPSDSVLVFVDNHDTQRKDWSLTFKHGALYDLAQLFTLAYPYGRPRLMSSFEFEDHAQGPPSENELISRVHTENGLNCGAGEWVCEHRRPVIAGAVEFRNSLAGETDISNWWTNGSDQIAFGLGNRGFVIINAANLELNRELQTNLPEGRYCNRLASGDCQEVVVGPDSIVRVKLGPMNALAIDQEYRPFSE